jgi:hypothetical protein
MGGKESDLELRAEDDRIVAEQTGPETEARRKEGRHHP